MDPQKLAQWMRQEHAAVGQLSEALGRRIAAVPAGERTAWWRDLCDRFEHFRAHLLKHMSLEEKDGYLSMVSDRRPALDPQVQQLKSEHRQMTAMMKRINDDMQSAGIDEELILQDVCHRIDRLLGYVRHHEECENLMVLSAYTDDIGTKD